MILTLFPSLPPPSSSTSSLSFSPSFPHCTFSPHLPLALPSPHSSAFSSLFTSPFHLLSFPPFSPPSPSPFFSHYKIVVVLNGASDLDTRTDVPDNTLRPYDNNNQGIYAAASIDVGNYRRTFIIGDGQIYTRNNMQFMNSALRANQDYVFFIRLYSSNPVSLYV